MTSKHTIHYIYKITCLIDNKFYYGMHSTFNINDNYFGSGTELKRSISKYGKENHIKEIIEYCKDREQLKLREREIVNKDLLKDPMCMNIVLGGEGGLGYISKEHYETLGDIGTKAFIHKLRTDEEFSKRFRKTMSEIMKKRINDGLYTMPESFNFTGRKHSRETKKKMSEIMKVKQKGEVNSQYGTMWITDGVENKKILKGSRIPKSWRKGRTISYDIMWITDGVKNKKIKKNGKIPPNWYRGKKSGSNGTMWITNGKENRLIKVTDTIPNDWYKGRVCKTA